MLIRDAVKGDLPAIQAIMNYYRANSYCIWDRKPMSGEQMVTWLESHTLFPYAVLVAEEGGKVVGYASLSRFRPHSGYDVTAENSIYVDPAHTRKGIGQALMEALLGRAQDNGLQAITAWIDSGNTESVRFHEQMGFTHVGMLKNVGKIDGKSTSVIIMQIELPQINK